MVEGRTYLIPSPLGIEPGLIRRQAKGYNTNHDVTD